jgi:hypothetical protein
MYNDLLALTVSDATASLRAPARKRGPSTPGSTKCSPAPARPRLHSPAPSRDVSDSQTRAKLKALLQDLMLSSARIKLASINEHVCPLCMALLDGNRLSTATPTPQHPRQQGRDQVLMRCRQLGRGCIKCVGGDHLRAACPLKDHTPWAEHSTCKACTLQPVGRPLTHAEGQTAPRDCATVGKNFVVEFCLAMYRYRPREMKRYFPHGTEDYGVPRYWDAESGLSDSDLVAFYRWIYSPIWPGAVLSKGLALTMHSINSLSLVGPAGPTLTPAHTLHVMRRGLQGELSCFKDLMHSIAN